MDEPEQLQIHVQLQSRNRVFDHSGHLPFSIVFGLCRGSSTDTDLRPLVLDITRSAFDVPYGLVHKLLTLQEHAPEGDRKVEVDLSRLTRTEGDDALLSGAPFAGR